MKKLELDIIEKNRILSLHKKMIQEQTVDQNQSSVGKSPAQIIGGNNTINNTQDNPDLATLRNYEQVGCLTGGEILANKDYTKYIYRKVSNNVNYDFYADGTYKSSNGQTGKYSCQDAIDKFNVGERDKNIETERSKWLTADKTNATQEELNNRSMWEVKNFNGVNYYRSVAANDITKGTTTEQKEIIDSWTATTNGEESIWKTADQMPISERQVAYKILASPKSEGIFNSDFYVYANQNQIRSGLSQNTCNSLINTFFDDWDKNIRKPNGTFAEEKLKVEICATNFKNRKIFGIGKTDDNLKVLNGEAKGGRTNSAPDRYSRFRLFNNVYKFDNK